MKLNNHVFFLKFGIQVIFFKRVQLWKVQDLIIEMITAQLLTVEEVDLYNLLIIYQNLYDQ